MTAQTKESPLAVLAALLVLFTAMLDARVSLALALVLLIGALVLQVYRQRTRS